MDLNMHCAKEQWRWEWFAAWHELSADAWIAGSDSIIQGEWFTWETDATFLLDAQILSDEIQMSSVGSKHVWGESKRNWKNFST